MRQGTKIAFDYITGCFSGEDGGVSFTLFQSMIDKLDQQAEAGDVDAKKLVAIVYQFAKMIQIASETQDEQQK